MNFCMPQLLPMISFLVLKLRYSTLNSIRKEIILECAPDTYRPFHRAKSKGRAVSTFPFLGDASRRGHAWICCHHARCQFGNVLALFASNLRHVSTYKVHNYIAISISLTEGLQNERKRTEIGLTRRKVRARHVRPLSVRLRSLCTSSVSVILSAVQS